MTSVFISYSHDDQTVARAVAAELQAFDYYVWIDEGALKIGDSLIRVISDAINQVDFVVAFVSPSSVKSNWCQKELALAMTGEVSGSSVVVMPVRIGSAEMPSSLTDKLYLDASSLAPGAIATQLHQSIERHRTSSSQPPPRTVRPAPPVNPSPLKTSEFEPIRLVGIDRNGVTAPRNDGSRGSGLYRVPFILSAQPSSVWAELMVRNWDMPPCFTTMHRPGIGSVSGDKFVLDGTTIEEVEHYHLATLKLALDRTNSECGQIMAQESARKERERQAREQHEASVNAAIAQLSEHL